MKQEKQKVIRVLKPTQKTKKISPLYWGFGGIAIGVLSVSALLFSSSKESSEAISASQIVNKSELEEPVNPHNDSSKHVDAQDTEQANTEDQQHQDVNEPKTKLSEIANIFKHKKQETAQANPDASPFDNAFTHPKQTESAVKKEETTKLAPPKIIPKPNSIKTTELPKTIQKPSEKNTTAVLTAPVAAVPKVKEPIKDDKKEPEVESPRATVQITVTKTVKEN